MFHIICVQCLSGLTITQYKCIIIYFLGSNYQHCKINDICGPKLSKCISDPFFHLRHFSKKIKTKWKREQSPKRTRKNEVAVVFKVCALSMSRPLTGIEVDSITIIINVCRHFIAKLKEERLRIRDIYYKLYAIRLGKRLFALFSLYICFVCCLPNRSSLLSSFVS